MAAIITKAAIKELQRADDPIGLTTGLAAVLAFPPSGVVANSAAIISGFNDVATHPQEYVFYSDNPVNLKEKENGVLVSTL